MTNNQTAILLMAFGTPTEEAQLVPYYTHIRHGHQPSSAMVKALAARYQAIGGLSPLARITNDQVSAIESELWHRGFSGPVVLGLAHVAPKIETVVNQLVTDGVTEIYGLPLAAHYSSFNSQIYHGAVKHALAAHPTVIYHEVNGFWDQRPLLNYWSQQLRATGELLADSTTRVLFSAHSLPTRTVQAGDPYKAEVERNVQLIADAVGLRPGAYQLGWQSAATGTQLPWIGPRFEDVATRMVKAGARHIISVPVGFINDNLEIDYDVDIALKRIVTAYGADLTRLPMPNCDPALIKAIADKLGTVQLALV